MDVELGPDKGIKLLEDVNKKQERPEVIMVSAFEKSSYIVPSIQSGAREYLVKPVENSRLLAEIENALWDKRHKTKETKSIKVNHEAAEILNRRTIKIMKLAYKDVSEEEIGKIFGIKACSVRAVISRACRKLSAGSREGAFKYLFE